MPKIPRQSTVLPRPIPIARNNVGLAAPATPIGGELISYTVPRGYKYAEVSFNYLLTLGGGSMPTIGVRLDIGGVVVDIMELNQLQITPETTRLWWLNSMDSIALILVAGSSLSTATGDFFLNVFEHSADNR